MISARVDGRRPGSSWQRVGPGVHSQYDVGPGTACRGAGPRPTSHEPSRAAASDDLVRLAGHPRADRAAAVEGEHRRRPARRRRRAGARRARRPGPLPWPTRAENGPPTIGAVALVDERQLAAGVEHGEPPLGSAATAAG